MNQSLIAHVKQRRAQGSGKGQIVLRRDQYIKQCHEIEHFTAVNQLGLFTNLRRDMKRTQRLLQRHQSGTFA